MGWSESYYCDMAEEAMRVLEKRVHEILEAFERLRLSAATYGHFHSLLSETLRKIEAWEAELKELLTSEP